MDASRGRPNALILAVVCVAQFMVVLDISIVNVALPSMQADLHASASAYFHCSEKSGHCWW